MRYKLLFIDEESEFHDAFKECVEAQDNPNIESFVEFPKPSLQEMLDTITDLSVDAVITDYKLNQSKEDIKYNIPYNGLEILNRIRDMRADFPCFLITAFDTDAVNNSQDVNIVYNKVQFFPEKNKESGVSFIEKVIKQIDHYRKKLDNAEQELCTLVEKRSKQETSLEDEKRIIELDSLLESSIDRRSQIPSELKELSNRNHLAEIINKADEILKRYETIQRNEPETNIQRDKE